MPVKIKKLPSGKYQVRTPEHIHAKATSLKNAKEQEHIINAAEHGVDVSKWGKKKKHG